MAFRERATQRTRSQSVPRFSSASAKRNVRSCGSGHHSAIPTVAILKFQRVYGCHVDTVMVLARITIGNLALASRKEANYAYQ